MAVDPTLAGRHASIMIMIIIILKCRPILPWLL